MAESADTRPRRPNSPHKRIKEEKDHKHRGRQFSQRVVDVKQDQCNRTCEKQDLGGEPLGAYIFFPTGQVARCPKA